MIAAKRVHFLLFQYAIVSPTEISFRFQNEQTENEGRKREKKKRCRKLKIVIGSVCMEEGFLYQEDYFTRFHPSQCLIDHKTM